MERAGLNVRSPGLAGGERGVKAGRGGKVRVWRAERLETLGIRVAKPEEEVNRVVGEVDTAGRREMDRADGAGR